MNDAALVVVGRVVGDRERQVTIEPEAYLKGAARPGAIRLENRLYGSTCEWAKFPVAGRVLVILDSDQATLAWPEPSAVFELIDGTAISAGATWGTEAALVSRVRSLTDQYAVPAASSGEGAGINWRGTVLPLGAALVVIFVIALFLMRTWHRIDPS